MADLTPKQRAFLEAYLTCWNATEAARRAGYSEKTARSIGHENLTKPDIKAALSARLAERAMEADEVLVRLTEQARADIRELYSFDDEGKVTGLNLHRDAPLHLIRSITPNRYGLKIEVHDQQGALTLLGKHHGLFVERQEITGKDGGPIELTDIRQRLLSRLTAGTDTSEANGSVGEPE